MEGVEGQSGGVVEVIVGERSPESNEQKRVGERWDALS